MNKMLGIKTILALCTLLLLTTSASGLDLVPLENGKSWKYNDEDDAAATWTSTMSVTGPPSAEYFPVEFCKWESSTPGCEGGISLKSTETELWIKEDGGVGCRLFNIDSIIGVPWVCNGYVTRMPNESVSVPYGDYPDAYVFHQDEGPTCNIYFWVVQGVGIVKLRDECTDTPLTKELDSITPGGGGCLAATALEVE